MSFKVGDKVKYLRTGELGYVIGSHKAPFPYYEICLDGTSFASFFVYYNEIEYVSPSPVSSSGTSNGNSGTTASVTTPLAQPSCNHKWVKYQPLFGESYYCCAHAGCGIKYVDWFTENNISFDAILPLDDRETEQVIMSVFKNSMSNLVQPQEQTEKPKVKPGWVSYDDIYKNTSKLKKD